MKFRNLTLGLAMSLLSLTLHAQDFLITQSLVSTCSGTLYDNGGAAASYGTGQNSICTISSAVPGGTIGIRLIQSQIGTGDTIRVYDGPGIFSPLLANITGGDFIGQSWSSGSSSGTLTLRFTSNADNSTGNFAFTIACNACPQNVPRITSPAGQIVKTCVGNPVYFSGATSSLAPGLTVASATWDFGDGSALTSSFPDVSHTYTSAGAYYTGLSVTSSDGCYSAMPAYILVEVLAPITASIVAEPEDVCTGTEVTMSVNSAGNAWTPELQGTGGYIPDNLATGVSSVISVSGSTQSTINSATDVMLITANLEHSYLNDFTITLTCPSGQSIVLHEQGGGGNWLGIPVDITSSTDPGTGWDYSWSPQYTSPTMSAAGAEFLTSVTSTSGAVGTSLLSGPYAAYGNWSSLVGCPINGDWTLKIVDFVSADDGFLFDWSLSLPGVTSGGLLPAFSSSGATDCNAITWTVPMAYETSENCNTITVVPNNGGIQLCQVTLVDDFGCQINGNYFLNVSSPIDGYLVTTNEGEGVQGSAEVHITQGTAPFDITWSNGTADVESINLSAGDYYVTISDSTGCSRKFYFNIAPFVGIFENGLQVFDAWYDAGSACLNILENKALTTIYHLYNAEGRHVMDLKSNGMGQTSTSLHTLAPGVYFLSGIREGSPVVVRFVKE